MFTSRPPKTATGLGPTRLLRRLAGGTGRKGRVAFSDCTKDSQHNNINADKLVDIGIICSKTREHFKFADRQLVVL